MYISSDFMWLDAIKGAFPAPKIDTYSASPVIYLPEAAHERLCDTREEIRLLADLTARISAEAALPLLMFTASRPTSSTRSRTFAPNDQKPSAPPRPN